MNIAYIYYIKYINTRKKMLLKLLLSMKEFRKKQGIRYEFAYVIYFSILAVLSGADSYRTIFSFIEARFEELKKNIL